MGGKKPRRMRNDNLRNHGVFAYPKTNPYAKADVRTPMMDGENTCDRQNNHQSTNNHLSDGQTSDRTCSVHHVDTERPSP